MGYILAKKVRDLVPYEPIMGDYPIRLDANESFFDLNDPASFPAEGEALRRQAAKKLAQKIKNAALNRYPDPFCTGVRRAFAKRFGIKEELVTAGNGSDELIGLICGCLLEKHSRLVTMDPDFSMYRFYGDVFELENTVWKKPEDLTVDPDEVIAFVKEKKADALIFSNPCNPTGLTLSREKAAAIVKALPKTLVVVDEAYMEFSDDQSVMGLAEECDNLLVLKTCSKALGLAGIRLGFAVAGENISRALRAVKSPYNVNALTQAAGEAVLESAGLLDWCTGQIIRSRKELEEGLKIILEGKGEIEKIYPSQTNFVFVKTPAAGKIAAALKEYGVVVRRMGGFLRITAGSRRENEALLKALGKVAE